MHELEVRRRGHRRRAQLARRVRRVQPPRCRSTSATASAGVEVADDGEDRPAGHQAGPVQRADVAGLDGGHVRTGGQLAGDRVPAEPLALQRLPGDRPRLRARHGDPLDEPRAFAQHLGVRVGRAREDVGEHLQDRRQPGREPRATDLQALGIHGDAQVRAYAGQLVVDRDPVAGGRPGEQGRAEQFGGREMAGDARIVGGGVRREGHPQPDLGHRDAGPVRGEHSQAGGQGDVEDVRQRHLPGGAERGQRPRAQRGAADLLGRGGS